MTETCDLGSIAEDEATRNLADWMRSACELQNSNGYSEGQAPKASDPVKRLRQPALRLYRDSARKARYRPRQEELEVCQR